ncbi:MAG: methyltransferase domain-containing protein [Thermoanaerobacteraceae bacterium]|nr:methyltransferase domain-containing protein [Thermoanaerobacteraceae bacterium]
MKDRTDVIRKRYDRIAGLYNAFESPMEALGFQKWRGLVFEKVNGKVLEVGVGTGKNMDYYPEGADITAVDFSPGMIEIAEKKRRNLGLKDITLSLMDIENLEFEDNVFDFTVSTFVFCSVPDPIKGLKELHRVLKRDGQAIFLEHVRSENPLAGFIMDLINPLVVGTYGANINRRTADNIKKAGFEIVEEKNLASDIVKFIVARPVKR